MRRLRASFVRLAAMFQRERLDRELAAELESHLAFQIEDNLRAGMTPEEARRQVRRAAQVDPTVALRYD